MVDLSLRFKNINEAEQDKLRADLTTLIFNIDPEHIILMVDKDADEIHVYPEPFESVHYDFNPSIDQKTIRYDPYGLILETNGQTFNFYCGSER